MLSWEEAERDRRPQLILTAHQQLLNKKTNNSDSTLSLKQRIYEEAGFLHSGYKDNDDLSPAETKRICAGLSGIVGTADNSSLGQKYLFNIDIWIIVKNNCSRFQQPLLHSKLESDLDL